MIRKFKQKDVTWLDIESPTKEDILQLAKDHNLHSLVTGELLTPSHQSHVDVYENYVYLVLHFPKANNGHHKEEKDHHEVDIILGHDFLITIRYESITPIEEFSKIFEAQMKLGDNRSKFHAGFLFHHIMKEMYRSLEADMDLTNSNLKRIEQKVFDGHEKEMIKTLAVMNRHLLDFRWALKPHKEILSSIEINLDQFFDSRFNHYSKSIRIQFDKVWEMLESNRELFREIKHTNDSLLTIKTNEIVKILTIVAFITFPLSVFTSTFGMNTAYTPILGHQYDFWIITAIMFSATVLMFIYFKFKKWL